jgi:hypothetical protein
MSEDATVPAEPAEATLGRVSRFVELLVDVGLADAFDEARRRALRAEAQPADDEETEGKQPSTITEQAAAGGADEEVAPEDLTVRLDMGRFLRAIGKEGQLARLGAILFDVAEEEAEKISFDDLEDAFFLYSVRCEQLTEMLAGSAVALA